MSTATDSPMTLDIRLLIPGLAFDPNDPLSRSLGGSETAGVQLAAAIARKDHLVTCFASVSTAGHWRDVNFLPAAGFPNTMTGIPCDLLLVQRAPLAFAQRNASRVNMLWVHDLLFKWRTKELLGTLHSIDRIVTVSDWQRRQYQAVAGDLPDDLFLVTRNGIDLNLIDDAAAASINRDPNLIMCAARPERGVDVLLTSIFPAMLRANPNVRLAICAYDCPNPALDQFYATFEQTARNLGGLVEWHGALDKAGLYRLMRRASAYVYPTPSPGDPSFADTSCIAVMEAMANGLPVIASKRGALAETIGQAGYLIDPAGEHCAEPAVVERFVATTLEVLGTRSVWQALHDAGLERARYLGWDQVAETILDETVRIMANACADPVRLTRHFIRRQDIEAARFTLDAASDLLPPPWEDGAAEKAAELD